MEMARGEQDTGAGGSAAAKEQLGSGPVGRAVRPKPRNPRTVSIEHPVRDMTYFTITGAELVYLGFSSGIGSAALGGAVYLYKQYADLTSRVPLPNGEILSQTHSFVWFLGALAVVSYLVFGGTVLKIKWSSGQRGWRLLF